MGKEIERKFLVSGEEWRQHAEGMHYRQGYLSTEDERTVRVRTNGEKGFLTIKGVSRGATRSEFEYEIPLEEAGQMLDELCVKPLIEKKRYKIPYEGFIWEVDEFGGDNAGLILAEVELDSEEQEFTKPPWIGEEVTGDPRYFNSYLVRHPWSGWKRYS